MSTSKNKISRSGLSGGLPASNPSGSVGFGSSLERDYLRLEKLNPKVSHFETQPLRIPYRTQDQKLRSYVPNVLVYYKQNQCPDLVEIKYRAELQKKWPELVEKYRAARAYCAEQGWRFRLYTERQIHGGPLDFARFMLSYLHGDPDPQAASQIQTVLIQKHPMSIGQCLNLLTSDPQQKAVLRTALWKMVAQGQVGISRLERPHINSLIWLEGGQP